MALSAKQIKTKIGSVKNVGKITKAMELVSVSKMKKAVEIALSARRYASYALELLGNLSREHALKHPLLTHGNKKANLIVLISSNKGLCGSYNVGALKGARTFVEKIHAKHESDISYIAIGKYAEKIAKIAGGKVLKTYKDIPENVSWNDVKEIVAGIREEFLTGKYYNVVLVYTNFVSVLSQEVKARQILPVSPRVVENMLEDLPKDERPSGNGASLYLYEPSEEELLEVVLPKLSDIVFFQGLLESRASEHSARRVAMKNASENAGKLVDELGLSYNRARQAAITQEIAEIASGANAF